jgi:hypothetical protein
MLLEIKKFWISNNFFIFFGFNGLIFLNDIKVNNFLILSKVVSLLISIVVDISISYFKLDKTFEELCKSKPRFDPDTIGYTEEQIAKSKLMYVGDILTIHNTSSCIIDILTRSLPTSKVVLEQTIQKSLASENNKIDLDTLVGIYEMLKSEDAEVIGTGLKALSMLDYIHFTNSVHYILSLVGYLKYRDNKATHFTSVKYMLKILNPTGRSRCWHYDRSIYTQDLELLKQLIKQLDPVYKDNVSGWLFGADFMYYDASNNLVTRIK